ncbi:MAG: hypothetical protein JWN04_3013 [Myxococcaceae bacterium]|nr:hypothetical protein [Myxococcaceae bacterium]
MCKRFGGSRTGSNQATGTGRFGGSSPYRANREPEPVRGVELEGAGEGRKSTLSKAPFGARSSATRGTPGPRSALAKRSRSPAITTSHRLQSDVRGHSNPALFYGRRALRRTQTQLTLVLQLALVSTP